MLKVCPRCGASSAVKKFIGSFCEDCFAERVKVSLPYHIPVTICKTCNRIRTDKWEPLSHHSLEKLVRKQIEGRYDNVRFIFPESWVGTASVVFLVQAGGSFFEIPRQFELVHKKTQCEDCSRASSGYFEAIIQLRGEENKVEKMRREFERGLSRRTFVAKAQEQKTGVDLYVGSNKEVLALVEESGLRAEITYTLHGVKNGHKLYRTTYCIRV